MLARVYDVGLLDLDGVVYIGPDPVVHAQETLQKARADGMRLAFVTNNASRPPDAVAAHLMELGVEAHPDEVITSAQAAARLLAESLPTGACVLVVGGEGLRTALHEKGLTPVRSATDEPAAVVQGFAPEVDWHALAEGAYAVSRGLPWVASNADRTIPTQRGIAPGNGALIDVIRAATGRDPVVAGKPEPPMHREAMLRTGAARPLVIGDRLDTDIEGAVRAGVDSLLVLTGVTSAEEVILAPPHSRPTYIGQDLRALDEPAAASAVRAGLNQRGSWAASVEAGRLSLHRTAADPGNHGYMDVVRAACGAAWNAEGHVDADSVTGAVQGALSALS